MAKKIIGEKWDAFKGAFKSKKEEDPFKKENQAMKDEWARQKELEDMRLRKRDQRNGWQTPPPSSTNYEDSEVDPDPPEGSQVDPDPPEQEKQGELERQRLKQEQAEKERLEQEQAEKERLEQEMQDKIERLEQEQQAEIKSRKQEQQAEIKRLEKEKEDNAKRREQEMQESVELFKKREREKIEQIENFLKSKNSKIVSVHQHQNTDMVRVFMGLVILTVVILVSLRLLFPEYFTQLAVSGIVLLGTLTFLSYWMKMTLGQRGPKKLL